MSLWANRSLAAMQRNIIESAKLFIKTGVIVNHKNGKNALFLSQVIKGE